MPSRAINACQVCSEKKLESILFLGYIPAVTTYREIGSTPDIEKVYPLELLRCGACTLVQIGFEVDPNELFTHDYPYRTASTKNLRENFADLHQESCNLLGLNPEDLIIDIGSNDGTLLSNFQAHGHKVLGVEPTDASEIANQNGVHTKNVFFSREEAKRLKAEYGAAKLITSANCFAHIVNINDIVEGILDLLGPNGVFINESHYVAPLVETLQYDTIYHEHLRNYSVRSVSFLLERHGLEVFHVKKIPTHGGSIRVYACRKGERPVQDSVRQILAEEDAAGITDGSALQTFRTRTIQSKLDLFALLAPIKQSGAKIYGIGAPARASMLISYLGLDDGVIDAIMEVKTSPKVGRYIPGTRIPIFSESKIFEDQPQYALLFSWHIADELMKNLRAMGYKGKFITPLPTPKILDI